MPRAIIPVQPQRGKAAGLIGLGFVTAVYLIIVLTLPLATAFQFGEDEGFEVIKPLLCNKGHALYTEIWNDQPPVLTRLLAVTFKVFGTSIWTARCVAVAFGLVLLVSFFELVRRRTGDWAAILTSLLLLTAPSVLLLSVSIMLELPAFATAIAAAWVLEIWGNKRHWLWLVISGALMAVALQIKLTSALVLPAVGLQLCGFVRQKPTRAWLQRILSRGSVWVLSLMMLYALIGFTWGRGSLATSWRSHTSTQTIAGLDDAQNRKFDPHLLLVHLESVLTGAVAVVLAARQKRMREIFFPLVLLATAVFVHTFHRPWWNYYYLHFAIPIAWLTGWGIHEILCALLRFYATTQFSLLSLRGWKMLVLCLLAALPLARSERRFEGILGDLRQRPSFESNSIISKMKKHAAETKWVYSESGIYPFLVGLPVPPELAIIMPKRFWSGQITTAKIIETCRRYVPEMIILPIQSTSFEWEDFLQSRYSRATNDNASVLFIQKTPKVGL